MILVTGGTGLLGSHLIFDLLSKGKHVRVLRRPDSNHGTMKKVFSYYSDDPDKLISQIEWVEGDILDTTSLADAMKGVREVFHCAAVVSFHPADKKALNKVNIGGTANVVNAALSEGITRLCHVSSIAAIGRSDGGTVIDENTEWQPSGHNSVYAASKNQAEREIWRGNAEGLEAFVVNPAVIIGAGNPSKGSTQLISTVWDGLRFYPVGSNGFVDVRDVAKAMTQLMEKGASGERYILSSENLTYFELFGMIAEALQVKAPSILVKPWLSNVAWIYHGIKSAFDGERPLLTKETTRTSGQKYVYSNRKIIEALDFQFTPMKEVIRHACDLFLQEKGYARHR
jgi:nucleoside-diphosphate-sugar epimerase